MGDGKLAITQTNNEDNNLMMGVTEVKCTPVLGLDVWEHAYWGDHDGESNTTYLDSFWTVVDWSKVSINFEKFNIEGKVAPLL